MKKQKIIVVFLVVLAIVSVQCFAYAQDSITSAWCELSISASSNMATCKSTMTISVPSYTAKLTMELQRQDSAGWVTIATWRKNSVPPQASVSMQKNKTGLLKGHYYRVKATAKAYNMAALMQTATRYSNIIYYS